MSEQDVHVLVTDFDYEAVGDDWETLVSAGIPVVEAHDRNRWALGTLGVKCERRYGDTSLAKFSRDIGLKSPSIMYDYTAVRNFFTLTDQAMFPNLTWSHYRAVLRVKTHEMAMVWLARAADEEWTVDDLIQAIHVHEGGDPKPQKLVEIGGQFYECRPVAEDGGDSEGYELVFRVAEPVAQLQPRAVYTLKVYGEQSEDDDE